jgi:hypothetical protein
MVSVDVGGLWWLPGHDNNKVAGFLTYDLQRGGNLRLIGALIEWDEVAPRSPIEGGTRIEYTEASIEVAGTYARILGEAEGKYYTLEDCFEVHRAGGFFGSRTYRQEIHVNRIFTNVHFNEGETAGGDFVSLSLEGLTRWVGRSGVRGTRTLQAPTDEPKFSLAGHQLPEEVVNVRAFGKLRLRHHIDLDVDVPSHVIAQEFSFGVDFSKIASAEDLLDVVSDLQDLVSIGTGRTAAFYKLTLFHPDLSRQLPDGRHIDDPIEFLARWSAVPSNESKSLQYHDMFFSLQDFGGMPQVGKWLAVARKHRATLGRVMASRYERGMYMSDRYLNRLASLEAFDRQERGKKVKANLSERLTTCAQLAGDPVTKLVPNVSQWIKVMVKDRNDIAHELGNRQREERVQWLYLGDSAYWLYVLCILRLAKAPDIVFQKIADHSEFTFLQGRLASFLT